MLAKRSRVKGSERPEAGCLGEFSRLPSFFSGSPRASEGSQEFESVWGKEQASPPCQKGLGGRNSRP